MEILPDDCVQVGKKELMYAGTVGLIIYLGGVIFINRKSTTSAKMVMAEVAKSMTTDKVSVTVAYVWVSWGGTRGCGTPGAGSPEVTATCSSWQRWLVAWPAGREHCKWIAGAQPYLPLYR